MRRVSLLAAIAAALLMGGSLASAQSIVFDFEDGTDQGFGGAFANSDTLNFPIVNIGGSNRMEIPLGGFQVASRMGGDQPFLSIFNQAAAFPSLSTISYDWYVDTAGFTGANFLQLGTFINSGSGAYAEDFPGSGKDAELNGTQLASGSVFSGTVSETLTTKYGVLAAGFLNQTFHRLGLIMNGDGQNVKVYFDNVTITAVPEPASLALFGLAIPALVGLRRRRS